jgi:hypothetical protein
VKSQYMADSAALSDNLERINDQARTDSAGELEAQGPPAR